MKIKKIHKKLFIIVIMAYLIYIFASQQKTINSYKAAQKYYSEQIAKEALHKETLCNKKKNINSEEQIEEVAREKLDMYLPNEKVYIDISK